MKTQKRTNCTGWPRWPSSGGSHPELPSPPPGSCPGPAGTGDPERAGAQAKSQELGAPWWCRCKPPSVMLAGSREHHGMAPKVCAQPRQPRTGTEPWKGAHGTESTQPCRRYGSGCVAPNLPAAVVNSPWKNHRGFSSFPRTRSLLPWPSLQPHRAILLRLGLGNRHQARVGTAPARPRQPHTGLQDKASTQPARHGLCPRATSCIRRQQDGKKHAQRLRRPNSPRAAARAPRRTHKRSPQKSPRVPPNECPRSETFAWCPQPRPGERRAAEQKPQLCSQHQEEKKKRNRK